MQELNVPQPVTTLLNMVLDVGMEPLIGALILAFLLAALTASTYMWLKRGKPDVKVLLVTLILGANLACFATGAGFIHWKFSANRARLVVDQPRRGAGVARRFAGHDTRARRASFIHRTPGPPLVDREEARN
jgi:hypothetical protein